MVYAVTVREVHSFEVFVEAKTEEEALKETKKIVLEEGLVQTKYERLLEPEDWTVEGIGITPT